MMRGALWRTWGGVEHVFWKFPSLTKKGMGLMVRYIKGGRDGEEEHVW